MIKTWLQSSFMLAAAAGIPFFAPVQVAIITQETGTAKTASAQ